MIIQTKLHIPHSRHSVISRPRLTRMLDEGKGAKLTLISAQAGYGKTTSLSEWVTGRGLRVAWVSLDRLDNDWAAFWHYVIAAIRQHAPDFGATCAPLFADAESADPTSAIKALLNELTLLPEETLLVLDDYQAIELPSIHESFRYLVEHLPPPLRIYIASRTDLPFPVARLMAKGEMHLINVQDLQFRTDEGIAFFRDTAKLPLTDEWATKIIQQTEGWISGMQLAAISLKRSHNLEESVLRFDGRQHLIFDYLLEEVFSGLPEPLRDFLLRTSVLSRMNQSLCQAVTGQPDSQEQLERLEQLNLFIIPLDERRHWYRYHHLLSLFLVQLASRTNRERFLQSHAQAAVWHEQQGILEEAVEHYLEGDRQADAVRVIEQNLPSFLQANVSSLRRWVSRLPEAALMNDPKLVMFSISLIVLNGQWDDAYKQAEQAISRFELRKEGMASNDWRIAMGNLHFFSGALSFLRHDLDRASGSFERAERFMPEESPFQMMGRNRYHGHESQQDLLAVIRDYREAEPFFLRWIQAWRHKRQFPFVGFMYAAYCSLLYEWDRLEEAERYILEVQEREDMQPYAQMMANISIMASRIQQARGRSSQAFEQLRNLEKEIDSPDRALFMEKIETERAALSLRLGLLQPAEKWMSACGLSHTDEASMDRIAGHLLLARVLAARGRFEEALGLMARLERLAASGRFPREQIRVAISHSVVLWQAGRKKDSQHMLADSLRMAEPQGYVRSFIDEGLPMAEMLLGLARSGLGRTGQLPYIERLLNAFNGTSPKGSASKPHLTAQETKVMALVAEGLGDKEIAHRMAISVQTVKFHNKNAYRKLKADNRMKAVQLARYWRLIP